MRCVACHTSQDARGGTRTHTPSRAALFKSAASAVPPPGQRSARSYAVTPLPWFPRNFPAVQELIPAGEPIPRGIVCRTSDRLSSRTPWTLAAAAAAVRRAPDRARPARQPARVRGARRSLPGAAARVLPAHALLQGGCGGRAAGGLRGRVQRDPRRRARDQRTPVAVPDRSQPLAQ